MNENNDLKVIGNKIRSLRKKKNISITKLASLTNVSSAYISKIERDLMEPSLLVLREIAKALKVDLPLLFTDELPDDVLVTSEETRKEVKLTDSHAKFQVLMPSHLKNNTLPDMSTIIVRIPGMQKDNEEFTSHRSSEFCFVIKGCIEYHTNKEIYRLYEGDSIYIEKEVPHLLYNPNEEETILFAAISSVLPRFQE